MLTNIISKIVMLCVICAATIMSGCVECNSDGFAEGETKTFDFIFIDEEKGAELELCGDITRDGEHYFIDCTMNAYAFGYEIPCEAKGRSDNIRLTMSGPGGIGDVSYNNCEGTLLFKAILNNSE